MTPKHSLVLLNLPLAPSPRPPPAECWLHSSRVNTEVTVLCSCYDLYPQPCSDVQGTGGVCRGGGHGDKCPASEPHSKMAGAPVPAPAPPGRVWEALCLSQCSYSVSALGLGFSVLLLCSWAIPPDRAGGLRPLVTGVDLLRHTGALPLPHGPGHSDGQRLPFL